MMTVMRVPARLMALILTAGLVALCGCGADAPPRASRAAEVPIPPDGRPTLAVLIVVDQFRADYLARFKARLTGGLARLQREGLRFEDALYAHANTQTSPGHASLSTGLPPSLHGIIANRWFDRAEGRMVGCVADAAYPVLDGSGGVSPLRMQAPALSEWIKQASRQSRVVSISGKDTAATLLAGRRADGVFWFDRTSGRFTTSRFYAGAQPEILASFARTKPVSALACATWERLDGPADLPEADPDEEPWEAPPQRVFPHKLPCNDGPLGPGDGSDPVPSDLYSEVRITPFLDDLVFDLADDAVDQYALGADGAPDLLALSLSATDFIGHRYGPDSQEVLDQVRRLDRRLAVFLDRLDRKVGLGRVLIVLTGDHGVTSCPERDRSGRVRRVGTRDLESRLARAVSANLGPGDWLEGFEADHLYLSDASARVEQAALEALAKEPSIERVYRVADLEAPLPAGNPVSSDAYLPLMRASWTKERGGDLMIRLHEGWMVSDTRHGSEHGSPYPADTRVPLIFRGPGIAAGSRPETVTVYRVAASIAQQLGVTPPAGLPEGPLRLAP